jgi:nucleoredoxin
MSAEPITNLLGKELRLPDGTTTATAKLLEGKTVLGLYFSAHWCPPCKAFTPELSKRTAALKAAGKELEVVFVSSDSDQAAFDAYASSMSFPALPFALRKEQAALSSRFGVAGIPCLVFVDLVTGEVITKNGRAGISAADYVQSFPYAHTNTADGGGGDGGMSANIRIFFLLFLAWLGKQYFFPETQQ